MKQSRTAPRQSTTATKAATLAKARRSPEARAFVTGTAVDDDLAEMLAEQAVEDVTTGDHVADDENNADVDEDFGGPFVETSGRSQYGRDFDATNGPDAEVAPFPVALGGAADDDDD